jgi:hypothetical protein
MHITTEMIIVIAAVALLAIVAVAAMSARRGKAKQHEDLRRRFGAEYDREVEAQGSVERAERELHAREKRVQQSLKSLPEAERVRFSNDWRGVQARFVDDPSSAVQAADDLIKAVMLARGYAIDSFGQRVADLTVEHADVTQHYRAARELADANREGRANTEELRQAVVHYRALFAALLEQPQTRQGQDGQDGRLQEARA